MPADTSTAQLNSENAANLCKSTNTFTEALTKLATCTNSSEKTRNATFINNMTSIKSDFDNLNSMYTDLITSGDSLFGTLPNQTALQQIKTRNEELTKRLSDLEGLVKKNDAIIERTDRDFIDAKDAMPETLVSKVAHVLDDYTLIALTVSYLFFALSAMYLYVNLNAYTGKSIGIALGAGFFVSALLFIIAINFL